MSEPILARRITWRDLRLEPVTAICGVCRLAVNGPDDAVCERCGMALHFSCWLERLSTLEESATFQRAALDLERDQLAAEDAAAVDRLVMLCQGCRS